MYMFVVRVFDSARTEVADVTIHTAMPLAIVDGVVSVHRKNPSRQGVIVADSKADVLPTTPVNKLKLANTFESPRTNS